MFIKRHPVSGKAGYTERGRHWQCKYITKDIQEIQKELLHINNEDMAAGKMSLSFNKHFPNGL